MSILYDLYATPIPGDAATSEPTYHARVCNKQTVDPATLISHICERSTLGKGDIAALFNELQQEISTQLLAGNRVNIPGLGYFSLSLQTNPDADPSSTRAQHIHVKRIEYRADAQLRNKVLSEATFERIREKNHSDKLSTEEIHTLVREHFKTHQTLTRQSFEKLCHFTRSKAYSTLHALLEEGFLENINTPRYPFYVLKAAEREKNPEK